ncbi:hypothetical protein ABPG77_009088 [Micractinium sp. CCAP 211/92]
MAAAVAWRLALPVYKSSPSALQRQQRARPAALLAHRAGARRLIVCEAASPQPSSPGSQPAGSGPFSQEELDMLQMILGKLEAQDQRLKEMTKKVKNMHKDLRDLQAELAEQVKVQNALVENSKRMQRLLAGEDKKQQSGGNASKGT